MQGPYADRRPTHHFLSWLRKYDQKEAHIVLGSRLLNITPYYGQTIYNLLKINHWALFFILGSEQFIIENVALNTVESITQTELELILKYPKNYFLRRSDEGDEIISCNHLIRFVPLSKIDSKLQQVKYIQSLCLDVNILLKLCLKYMRRGYVFLGRNCQTFSRYINYGLGGWNAKMSRGAMLELNIDGFSYLVLFGVIIMLMLLIMIMQRMK